MGQTIVGHCPKCGAPIYSPSEWMATTPPPATHSCNCFPQAHTTTSTGTSINTEDTTTKQVLED